MTPSGESRCHLVSTQSDILPSPHSQHREGDRPDRGKGEGGACPRPPPGSLQCWDGSPHPFSGTGAIGRASPCREMQELSRQLAPGTVLSTDMATLISPTEPTSEMPSPPHHTGKRKPGMAVRGQSCDQAPGAVWVQQLWEGRPLTLREEDG